MLHYIINVRRIKHNEIVDFSNGIDAFRQLILIFLKKY